MSQPKRFKYDYTSFEQLPNELFLEIFVYLNNVDTVYTFSQLNSRFHYLLINYIDTFDFKSISKLKFDCVTKNHDIHQWRSLRLSEDDKTPGQIKLFCQLYPPRQYISQLQSLCILNLKSTFANEFLSELVSFNHLVSLTIGTICGDNIQPFELPSLQRLVVTACGHTNWMMNFRHLESLEFTIKYNCSHGRNLTLPTTLNQLKLFYAEGRDGDAVRTSLRQLSQLTKLALYDNGDGNPMPFGRKWEELIQSSIPLLKTFQFCFLFHYNLGAFDYIKQAVASFSTPFYLLEKRWFIRCDSDSSSGTKGTLYSLPFAFTEMPININSFDTSLSTLNTNDIDEAKYDSYKMLKTLLFNRTCLMPYRGFLTSNIVRLVLKTTIPNNWHFLLTNLRHLEIRTPFQMSSTDFAHFLTKTSQLVSLTLPILTLKSVTDNFTNTAVCDQLSHRIQSLTISHPYSNDYDLGIVSVHTLSSLARIFGKTCHHLSLALRAQPSTVLPILRRMRQLRSLHIRRRSYPRLSQTTTTSWLEQLPTETGVSDFIHVPDENDFYIWFGNRL